MGPDVAAINDGTYRRGEEDGGSDTSKTPVVATCKKIGQYNSECVEQANHDLGPERVCTDCCGQHEKVHNHRRVKVAQGSSVARERQEAMREYIASKTKYNSVIIDKRCCIYMIEAQERRNEKDWIEFPCCEERAQFFTDRAFYIRLFLRYVLLWCKSSTHTLLDK